MHDSSFKSLKRIFEMTELINSSFELPQIFKVLVDAISTEIMQADLVGIFLKQPDGTYRGHVGKPDEFEIGNSGDKKLLINEFLIDPAKDAFVQDIINNKTYQYIPDTSQDDRADPMKVQLLKIQSILGLPIMVNDDVFAIVFVHDFGKRMDITPEQLQVIEAFVNMTSVAIRNIQMFEQIQDLLTRQQSLLDATDVLIRVLNTDEK